MTDQNLPQQCPIIFGGGQCAHPEGHEGPHNHRAVRPPGVTKLWADPERSLQMMFERSLQMMFELFPTVLKFGEEKGCSPDELILTTALMLNQMAKAADITPEFLAEIVEKATLEHD